MKSRSRARWTFRRVAAFFVSRTLGMVLGLVMWFGGAGHAWIPATVRAQEVSSEPQECEARAVWLLNFARFMDWPPDTFAGSSNPIIVGITGEDSFGPILEKAFAAKKVKGRPLRIERFTSEQDVRGCHLLFIAASERKRYRDLFAQINNAPVLTVGETDDFLEEGGMIQFVRTEGEVRFAVDLNAAKPAKLKLSVHLLKFAVSVKGRYD